MLDNAEASLEDDNLQVLRTIGDNASELDMAERLLQGAREIRGKAERVIDKIR
jgi:hypothetical protein